MAKHEQEESDREHARDSDHLIVHGVPPSALFFQTSAIIGARPMTIRGYHRARKFRVKG